MQISLKQEEFSEKLNVNEQTISIYIDALKNA